MADVDAVHEEGPVALPKLSVDDVKKMSVKALQSALTARGIVFLAKAKKPELVALLNDFEAAKRVEDGDEVDMEEEGGVGEDDQPRPNVPLVVPELNDAGRAMMALMREHSPEDGHRLWSTNSEASIFGAFVLQGAGELVEGIIRTKVKEGMGWVLLSGQMPDWSDSAVVAVYRVSQVLNLSVSQRAFKLDLYAKFTDELPLKIALNGIDQVVLYMLNAQGIKIVASSKVPNDFAAGNEPLVPAIGLLVSHEDRVLKEAVVVPGLPATASVTVISGEESTKISQRKHVEALVDVVTMNNSSILDLLSVASKSGCILLGQPGMATFCSKVLMALRAVNEYADLPIALSSAPKLQATLTGKFSGERDVGEKNLKFVFLTDFARNKDNNLESNAGLALLFESLAAGLESLANPVYGDWSTRLMQPLINALRNKQPDMRGIGNFPIMFLARDSLSRFARMGHAIDEQAVLKLAPEQYYDKLSAIFIVSYTEMQGAVQCYQMAHPSKRPFDGNTNAGNKVQNLGGGGFGGRGGRGGAGGRGVSPWGANQGTGAGFGGRGSQVVRQVNHQQQQGPGPGGAGVARICLSDLAHKLAVPFNGGVAQPCKQASACKFSMHPPLHFIVRQDAVDCVNKVPMNAGKKAAMLDKLGDLVTYKFLNE